MKLPPYCLLSYLNYSENASRLCHGNGTWDSYSNYTLCKALPLMAPDASDAGSRAAADYTFAIYLVGYSLSLVALLIACSAFLYFK